MLRSLLVFGFAAALGGVALADDPAAPPAGHPCAKIVAACQAAGYSKGGASGKDLRHDCMKPIMTGGSAAGVTVDANDVQACKAKMQAHRGKQPPPAPPAQP